MISACIYLLLMSIMIIHYGDMCILIECFQFEGWAMRKSTCIVQCCNVITGKSGSENFWCALNEMRWKLRLIQIIAGMWLITISHSHRFVRKSLKIESGDRREPKKLNWNQTKSKPHISALSFLLLSLSRGRVLSLSFDLLLFHLFCIVTVSVSPVKWLV